LKLLRGKRARQLCRRRPWGSGFRYSGGSRGGFLPPWVDPGAGGCIPPRSSAATRASTVTQKAGTPLCPFGGWATPPRLREADSSRSPKVASCTAHSECPRTIRCRGGLYGGAPRGPVPPPRPGRVASAGWVSVLRSLRCRLCGRARPVLKHGPRSLSCTQVFGCLKPKSAMKVNVLFRD
jgi:hypothetical protein